MKIKKSIPFFLGVLVVLSAFLAACGGSQFVPGSVLICPTPYDPNTSLSLCRIKQTESEQLADPAKEAEYAAVYLSTEQVGVYKDGFEYGLLTGNNNYHPVPADYVRTYSTAEQFVVSNVDPAKECGTENGFSCLGSLGDIVMKGNVIFGASYDYVYTLSFSDPTSYKDYYEASIVTNTGERKYGFEAYMTIYNDRFRDALRESNSVDPTDWLSGEKVKSDIEPIWLAQLEAHPKMKPYSGRVLIKDGSFTVRYFQPEAVGTTDQAQSNQVAEDLEFQKFITRRNEFCGEFPAGSQERLQCYATFVCYEVQCEALVNNTKVILDVITLEPTPVVTETP